MHRQATNIKRRLLRRLYRPGRWYRTLHPQCLAKLRATAYRYLPESIFARLVRIAMLSLGPRLLAVSVSPRIPGCTITFPPATAFGHRKDLSDCCFRDQGAVWLSCRICKKGILGMFPGQPWPKAPSPPGGIASDVGHDVGRLLANTITLARRSDEDGDHVLTWTRNKHGLVQGTCWLLEQSLNFACLDLPRVEIPKCIQPALPRQSLCNSNQVSRDNPVIYPGESQTDRS